MVASAIHESSETSPVRFTVLSEKNMRVYLRNASYPPFVFNFNTSKKAHKLFEESCHFIINQKEKSVIERTAIAYTFSERCIEQEIFRRVDWGHIVYRPAGKQATSFPMAVLLPPSFYRELYQATASLESPPPSNHTWMFGYTNNKQSLEALSIGRLVSIASPLFEIDYVHGFTEGKQLGITVHDLIYHMGLDWQNPHTELFIKIGETLLSMPNQTTLSKKLGILFLDRETLYYSTMPHEEIPYTFSQAFWLSISRKCIEEIDINLDLTSKLFIIFKENLPPELISIKLIKSVITYYKQKTTSTAFEAKKTSYQNRISFLERLIQSLNYISH